MASPTSSVLSQMLRNLAESKTHNMSKLRAKILEQKDNMLTLLGTEQDPTKRLAILRDGIEACHAIDAGRFGQLALENPADADYRSFWPDFRQSLDIFIHIARMDLPSLDVTFEEWETTLLAHLETMCARLDYNFLHANIVKECLHTDGDEPTSGVLNNEATLSPKCSGNRAKDKQRRQWEEDAFSPTEIDKHALHEFLEDVFVPKTAGSNRKAKAMEDLSATIKRFERGLTAPNQFNLTTLEWVISSLSASRRLSQDKQEALRKIKSNRPILDEISDVLNSRMQNLQHWSWGDSVSLGYRQNVKDKYIVDMQEDLLQAIFLHYIGVRWSDFFKDVLPPFFSSSFLSLSTGLSMPDIYKQSHACFCGGCRSRPTVQHVRHSMYREHYHVNRLLDMETQGAEEAEAEMKRVYTDEPAKSRTKLAQILWAESAINIRLRWQFTVLQSSFSRWNDLLPHAAVLGMLEFMGVSGDWLLFFQTFLEAPLRFRTDPADTDPRTRRRGTPDSHVLSDVFSEVVLFCADCAANQATGGRLLYRSLSDLWFWSPSEANVVSDWATIQKFAAVTGTQLCNSSSGCVRLFGPDYPALPIDSSLPRGEISWGLLRLSPVTGSFEIKQDRVDLHVRSARKLLRREFKNIFALVQELNIQQDRLFHLLGVKANSFGRDHATMALHAYASLERQIFQYDAEDRNGNNFVDSTDAAEYLKVVLSQRFTRVDIPNAYLFFPAELGGLGLKSASIALPLIRDLASESSSSLLDKIHYGHKNNMVDVYCKLTESAPMESSLYDTTGLHALSSELHGRNTLRKIASRKFPGIGSYWRRVILLYGQEALERFGSLKLVDKELLPMGTLSLSLERQ
ncbi:hypothetical protein PG984_015560 [Apiospora sp. TS-2023a]